MSRQRETSRIRLPTGAVKNAVGAGTVLIGDSDAALPLVDHHDDRPRTSHSHVNLALPFGPGALVEAVIGLPICHSMNE